MLFFCNGKQKFGGAIKAKCFLGLWKFMTDANYGNCCSGNCLTHRYSRYCVFIAREGTYNGKERNESWKGKYEIYK